MPELPDVEGFRQVLSEHTGEPIRAVRVRDPGVLRGIGARRLAAVLRGHRFERPRRHGKWLIAPAGGPVLMLHFGMTGSLSWHSPEEPWHRHDRVVWQFDDGELRYRDMRKLQGIRLAADEAQAERVLGGLGPDAREVSYACFARLLSGRRGRLKPALIDQAFLAGLGNLLADEICWHAGVDPRRAVADLDEDERAALYGAMRRVLRVSIKAGCVPARDTWLTGARDEPGGPCPRCGTPLSRGRIAGRTTVWCPVCQPL
ncbi:DNA-formamidopyrimidine glycosylase family protein [Nonomuraea sp. NPDC052116]|uniref:Fpg/Nei family DNA glycosylase n=1 Tax=Nonomuraea sp. NPDC052116 TaxID=3155665 RepID=UPI00341F8E1B